MTLLTIRFSEIIKICHFLGLLVLFGALTACSSKSESGVQQQGQYTNHLANETSPYLLQHANNPVDWYPWGEEALAKAKEENKLLVISIGYSACHWCHVMERESYQDTAVARIMNENFVSIKIDREERPDIDQVYIEAAQMLNNGQAGWPLNVIALPNATPVFAGTYFPKEQWLRLLNQIGGLYDKNPQRLLTQAGKIREDLEAYNSATDVDSELPDEKELLQAMDKWKGSMDPKNGGIQTSQKFPIPSGVEQLMNYGYLNQDEEALQLAEITLDKMALGGIYDHVGGGFHRYTVEPTWKIPHFEKMLYDNAQLVSLYSKAYQVYGKEMYKDAAVGTLDFILRDMTSDEGGFYSSFDADSEEEEGKFYIWTESEIVEALGQDSEGFRNYFTIEKNGNWEEGKNVLFAREDLYSYFETEEEVKMIKASLKELYPLREKREKPLLDDKILTSWNALMINGFVDAYNAFGDQKYLNAAIRNANFLIDSQMDSDGRLNRNYKDGKSAINAFLDDYAHAIAAYIELYEATFDMKWLNQARKLTVYTIDHFYDTERKLFHYKSDLDESLIVDKYVINDNVIPSGNSVMAYNLHVLGNLYYDDKTGYAEISTEMLANVTSKFMEAPYYYYGWLPVYRVQNQGLFEIAIVGEDYKPLLAAFQQQYFPDAIFLGGEDDTALPLLENKFVEGDTYIYVCRDKYCKLPVQSVEIAVQQIDRTK